MSELFDTKEHITGNLAKVQVLEELSKIKNRNVKILDVGCIGPSPLEFWRPLLYDGNYSFELCGVDVQGILKGEEVLKREKWSNIKLVECNAYNLSNAFKEKFDIVVATQVLEHIKYPERFLKEIYEVTKVGGVVYLTLDSAHYSKKNLSLNNLKDSLIRIARQVLGFFGKERYHDVPIYDWYIEPLFRRIGFGIVDKRFYNIHPLKEIHNHSVTAKEKNVILKNWKELEDALNNDKNFIVDNKKYFLDIYYKLLKP